MQGKQCAEEILLQQLQEYSGYKIPPAIHVTKNTLLKAKNKKGDQQLMYVIGRLTKLTVQHEV